MSRLNDIISVLARAISAPERARHVLVFAVFTLFGAGATWGLGWLPADPAIAQTASAPAPPTLLSQFRVPILRRAHCFCRPTCTRPDGTSFAPPGHDFEGYTQAVGQNDRCVAACRGWVQDNIAGWASENNICGTLSCSADANIGTASAHPIGVERHQRTCCPAASNGEGCGPSVGTDLTSVIRQVQVGTVTGDYRLFYTIYPNMPYDAAFQAFAAYVKTQRPTLHHMWVGYGTDDVTNPSAPVPVGWASVRYLPNGSAGNPSVGFISPSLQVNRDYEVSRHLLFRDAQDRDIPYFGDPSCTRARFRFRISVVLFRSPSGARIQPRAMATISVAGQPDRVVPIEAESPTDRDRRLQIERNAPATPPLNRPGVGALTLPGTVRQR